MQPVPRTEHFGSFVTLRSPWGHHRAFSNAFTSGLRFRAERCQQHIAEIALAALASHLVASHDYHHSELSKKSVQNMQRLQVQISIKDINQKKSCLETCLKAWAATVRQEKNAHAEQSHPWFGNYWKFTGNQTETRTFEPADGDQQCNCQHGSHDKTMLTAEH